MVTVSNQRKVYTMFDMRKLNEVRTCLEQTGIEYIYRTVSQDDSADIAPNNRNRIGSVGVSLQKDLEYLVYVKRSDYGRALHVLK